MVVEKMKCKTCQKSFHACTNCSFSNFWEYDYCTEKCWKNSPVYKDNYNLIINFLNSLTDNQLDQFRKISELDSDYENIIEDLIDFVESE